MISFALGFAAAVGIAILFPTRFAMLLFWVSEQWAKVFKSRA